MIRLKKSVALLQSLFIVLAMISAFGATKPVSTQAAVAGITNNGVYQIVNAYNGKALTQYYLKSARSADGGGDLYAQVGKDTKDNDGGQVNLYSKVNGEPRQIWRIQVKKWGLIYGLLTVGQTSTGINADNLVLGSDNKYVKAYESSANGTLNAPAGASETAKYFVQSMEFGEKNPIAFGAEYLVKAYAQLEDGTLVYGDAEQFTVYHIADVLYQNKLMKNAQRHNYLYDNILKQVDTSYQMINY